MRTSRHITPVLHKASFFTFKRTACLRGQTRLQRQYRLFSFLLLWAAVLLLVLNLLQNSVHLRLWGGPQLCAGNIRDLSTLAHAQQPTDWQLFSRPRTNNYSEKHQFCMTIGDLSLKEHIPDYFSHLPQEFAVIRSNRDLDCEMCFLALSTELYISLRFTLTLTVISIRFTNYLAVL